MFMLFFRAILAAVLYGPYLALLTVPVAILAAAIGAVLGTAISVLMLLGLPGVVISIPLSIGVSIGVTAFVNTQAARYACSITGLRPLHKQREFKAAFWDCFILVLIVNLLLGIVVIGAVTAGVGVESTARLVGGKLVSSPEEVEWSGWMWIVVVATLLPIGIYGFFIVPRACLIERAPAVYGMGWILIRFLFVLPLFAGLTGLGMIAVIFAVTGMSGLTETQKFWILASLIVMIFFLLNGFLMSFEARFLALVAARHPSQQMRATPEEIQTRDIDYRALREEWSQRG
ncbi:MAG: hypothetical protein AB8B85_08080 [Paracoccaceae bacterium]